MAATLDPDPVAGFDADVVVIGYGPVGVTAANALGRSGVRTIVLERERDIYPRARAVTVNDWTLRIFQQLGLDEAVLADMEENGHLHWRTYAGKEVFSLRHAPGTLGHPTSMMIYQPAMEATLREGVQRFTDHVDVRFGVAMTGLEQDADGVTVTVTDATTGEASTVRARWALACDGGSSRTRTALGVELIGSTLETEWIVIDAEIVRWWPGCKDLVFWSDPERPVVDIPLSLGNHRWEFPLRPGEKREDFDSEEAIWGLLEPMGRTREEVRLKQHAFYVHHVRHAERWRVGRTLLLGDAAHMMPPWAGQGMQSGVRDAHNVAWKLREVLAGRLDESILDTYEAERAPDVAAVTETSGKLGMLISSRDPRFIFLRNTLGPVLKKVPLTRRLVSGGGAPAIGAGWITGTPGKVSAVGRMLPQPPVATASGHRVRLDDVLDGFAVLGFDVDPASAMSASARESWSRLGARFVTVRPASGAAATDEDLIDTDGLLGSWFETYGVRVVAVRPDFFVAATDTGGLHPPTGVRELAATADRAALSAVVPSSPVLTTPVHP